MTTTLQMDTHQDSNLSNKDGISLILPIYNEEKCIRAELDRSIKSLSKTKKPFEIIIIDDCSTDNSKKIIKELLSIKKQENNYELKFIENKKNYGSGHSRKIGSIEAKYENIIWTDVDMSYPNDKLNELYDFYINTSSDMTIGSRESEQGFFKLLRFCVKFLIRKFAEYLCEDKIEDLNSGYRIFKKSVAKNYFKFLPRGFSCVTTITFSFLCNDHNVNYMKIEYFKRSGSSKFNIFTDTIKYLRQIILMTLMFNPMKICFSLFIIFLMISLIIGCAGLIMNSIIPNSASMFFLLSFLFLFFGAMAEVTLKLNSK